MCEEFQTCLAETIHKDIIQDIKGQDVFSILIDESTNIAINKHLVLYARIVDSTFEPKTYFLRNVTLTDAKSDAKVIFRAVSEALKEEGLDLGRVTGFGSDGAAVMVGRKSGVATQVKQASPHCVNVHCMAHRLNRASSQASKNIPFIKEVEATLADLYHYFGGSQSGNRKCELEQIQKILEEPVLSIKECHEIRWLAFYEAVKAVHFCWASLVTFFRARDDSKGQAIYNMLLKYKFLAEYAHGHPPMSGTAVSDFAAEGPGFCCCPACTDQPQEQNQAG